MSPCHCKEKVKEMKFIDTRHKYVTALEYSNNTEPREKGKFPHRPIPLQECPRHICDLYGNLKRHPGPCCANYAVEGGGPTCHLSLEVTMVDRLLYFLLFHLCIKNSPVYAEKGVFYWEEGR